MNRFLLTHSPAVCLGLLLCASGPSVGKNLTLAFIYRYWFRLQLYESVELFEMEMPKPSLSAVSPAPVESLYVWLTLLRALNSHTSNTSLIYSHIRYTSSVSGMEEK